MVFIKNNKKGQAAIEFLMTYGWMLLVVLIVGALVFSFVDFGSLLPNKVDMSSSSIRGDPAASAAYSDTYSAASDTNKIYVGFSYTGANKVTIDISDITLITALKTDCNATELTNDITTATFSVDGKVPFLTGHLGTITFDCSVTNGAANGAAGPLFSGDVFEGTISIGVKDTKRANARAIPSTGSVRLSIQ